MGQDEVLFSLAEDVKNFAVVYLVDITEVPDFCSMYELYDPCTTMFFFRNKHIMVDLGTGNNNKINWNLNDKQEMIDIIETVYRGAKKGELSWVTHSGAGRGWRRMGRVVAPRARDRSPCRHFAVLLFSAGRGLVVSPKDYSTKYRY